MPSSPHRSDINAPASHAYSPQKKRKRRLVITLIGLIILLAGVFFFIHHHQGGKKGEAHNAHGGQAQAVVAASAITGNMPVIFQLLGTVVPVTNVTITPRVNGHILAVYYQEGQHVKKGDPLELIDPRPYEAVLAQYKGTLAADQAQLAKAKVDNARYQRLVGQKSIAIMTARDQSFTVEQLEGQVKFDEANVRNAELNVMYCHITAPIDGRVGIRALDAGNYVTAGQSGGLTTLTQIQPISVIFTLPQNNLYDVQQQLQKQGQLIVEAWDSDNTRKLATGTTKALDSQIDTATGTVRLRGIFPNEDERLFPNEFVNAHLLVKTLQNVLLIPSPAVQTGPDGNFVYIVKPDMTIALRPVKTGQSNDTQTVILSGLKEGEKVVTDGINHLRPGSKVFLADASRPSRPALPVSPQNGK